MSDIDIAWLHAHEGFGPSDLVLDCYQLLQRALVEDASMAGDELDGAGLGHLDIRDLNTALVGS